MKYGIRNIEQVSRHCYYAGLGLGLLGMIGIITVFVLKISAFENLPECCFLKATGYYCPGCGGTRAVRALLQGRFLKSLYYHPFVGYILAYYIAFETTHTLAYLTRGKVRGLLFCPVYFYVGIALILVQWFIKLYLQLAYGFSL